LVSTAASAYRTGADLPELAGTDRVRFAANEIHFSLFPSLPAGLDALDVMNAVSEASHAWTAPACTALTLSFDGTTSNQAQPGDGINTVQWVFDWSARNFDPQAAGATDVQYKKAGGVWVVTEADVYLNGTFAWTTLGPDSMSRRDVRTVVTHELGHLLGLLHPCELGGASGAPDCAASSAYANACMFPIYNASQSHLSDDDVAGACFLYPGPRCSTTGCPTGQQCTDRGCRALCQGQVCADSDICTPSGCHPPNDCSGGCVGAPCSLDSHCGSFEHCQAGVCAQGATALGQACSADAECHDGACVAGRCARRCSDSLPCPGGQICGVDRVCLDGPRPLGAPCETADQCSDKLCVAGAAAEPICTRACGGNEPSCPDFWSCETASGRQVCAPQDLDARGGCSMSASARRGSFSFIALALALFATRRLRKQVKEKQL
jgi:hypothetical protein